MKARDFETLVNKLKLHTRNSYDRLAWFEYDGKKITRTRRSHGRKDPRENDIRRQLKVSRDELAGLIRCTLDRDDYVDILKAKNVI